MKSVSKVAGVLLCACIAVLASVVTTAGPAEAVVGGAVASYADYPYFASFTQPFGVPPNCGGSVIADSWVLTAAHCVNGAPTVSVWIPGAGKSSVGEVIPHPLWKSGSDGHDIALVRLPPGATAGVTPLQVGAPWNPGAYAAGTPATIMGTGQISANDHTTHDFHATTTTVQSDDHMRDVYDDFFGFGPWNSALMIGAGTSGKTVCYGDSGGPLVVNQNGHPVQIGVADFTGDGDDACTVSGAFARLYNQQLAWVASVVPAVAAGWGRCPLDGGTTGQPTAAYTTSVIPGAYTDGAYYWSIGCVTQPPASETVVRASDGFLWEATPDAGNRRIGGGLGVAAGTSPAVAALSTVGREIAFHATGSDDLWTVDATDAVHDTGVPMAAGSSPAIAALPAGGFEIVFAGTDNYLRELGPDGIVRYAANVLGVAPGTSPAIAAGPQGGFEIAFHAWGLDTAWTVTPDNIGHDTGAKIAAGGSPAITALAAGGFETAFAEPDGLLRELGPDGTLRPAIGAPPLATGTSPALAGLATGGFEIAYQAGGGRETMWTIDPDGTVADTGRYPTSGTGPAIVAWPTGGYGTSVAIGTSGNLVLVGPDRTGHDTGLTVAAGSSPAVASARVGAIAGYAGKCLDVAGGNAANGTRAQIWDCNGTDAQRWFVAPDGTVRSLGKCLDVSTGSTADGARVQIWDCNGTGAQVWRATTANELRNPQSGKCLDAIGPSSANGTPLQIWTCSGGTNQTWYLPADTSGDLIAPPDPPATVPHLAGDTLAQATNDLEAAGLTVGTVHYLADPLCTSINQVMHQSPAAGTDLDSGGAVSVTIGTAPATPCR